MNPDNNQPANQPPVQIVVEPNAKKSGLRPEWVIVGLVCTVALCITVGGLINLLAPQYNEVFGYTLAIGVGVAAVVGVIIVIIQDVKRKRGNT